MKGTIEVFLDGKRKRLARGMRVRHLLGEENVRSVEQGEVVVVEDHGYEVGLDGSLLDGMHLHLRRGER